MSVQSPSWISWDLWVEETAKQILIIWAYLFCFIFISLRIFRKIYEFTKMLSLLATDMPDRRPTGDRHAWPETHWRPTYTYLNSKSWYSRATVAREPYTKFLILLNGTVQTMHRVYSTISVVHQIGVDILDWGPNCLIGNPSEFILSYSIIIV